MSVFNNKNTLVQLYGKLWLTRAIDFSNGEKYQNINICFQSGEDDFIAIDYMRLEPDGNYYKKTKRIGKFEDPAFRKYFETEYGGLVIEQSGVDSLFLPDDAIFTRIAKLFEDGSSLKSISKEVGLSEQKVRKVLITKGLYESELSNKIIALLESGKTVADVQNELNLTRGAITSYLPYGFDIK